MHALSLVFRALLEPGDEVIVPVPCYFFGGLIERAGGVFVPVPGWDPEAIERAVTPSSRALVLTNPNNPDGYLPTRAEIDELLALASRQGLTVITDEAYERCIHEGELASAWGAPNVILVRSLGKSLAMPAWRLGFVAAEPSVIDACLRELEWDVIRVGHVAQQAATAALDGPQDWLDEVAAAYRRDRDAAHAAIAEHPTLSAALPAAGPFLWLELGGLSSDDVIAEGLPGRRRRRLRHARVRASSVRRLRQAPWLTATGSASTSVARSPTSSCSAPTARCARRRCCRRPTTTRAGVVQGVLELLEETGAAPASVTKVVHATTVASNAVLEGKGSRCALLTTAGFRDVLELRRLRIPVMYELQYEKPPPLVPRRLRYEIPERTGPRGEEWIALDEEAVREAAGQARDAGVAAVAISFLHAYANPAHERRAAAIVREVVGDDVYITCSSEILAEIREYERTSTAVVNAYVGPVVQRYIRSLESSLAEAGISAPLQIMQSSGGLMSAESAIRKPAHLVESGPAAGVVACAFLARAAGIPNVISLDMGGTTAKAAILEDGQPVKTSEYEVGAGINLSSRLIKGGGHAIRLPFIDLSEIGAGGGSLVSVDEFGMLRVGPESAGADPGPACYGLGSDAADADRRPGRARLPEPRVPRGRNGRDRCRLRLRTPSSRWRNRSGGKRSRPPTASSSSLSRR